VIVGIKVLVWKIHGFTYDRCRQPSTSGEEGDKNKDLPVFVDEGLAKINNFMATLTSRVDDIDKCLEELESMVVFEELRRKVQGVVNSVVTDVNKDVKIQAYEARIEAFEA